MSLGLIISRFGRIGTQLSQDLSSSDLYQVTKSQSDLLSSGDVFESVNAAVDQIISKWDPASRELPTETTLYQEEQIFSSDFRHSLAPSATLKTYTSLLPDRRVVLKIANHDWILRTRASFAISTSTLEPPRLWWTTEGMPIPDRTHRSSPHIPKFLNIIDEIEAAAIEALQNPFNAALIESGFKSESAKPSDRSIQIRLADNDHRSFAKLSDVLFYARLLPSQINEGRERDGLQALKSFVEDASANRVFVSDQSVKAFRDVIPGVSSVVCRGADSSGNIVVGFARSAGAGPAYQVQDPRPFAIEQENYTRRTSAARRFSAHLADLEARHITGRLPALTRA